MVMYAMNDRSLHSVETTVDYLPLETVSGELCVQDTIMRAVWASSDICLNRDYALIV